MTETEWFAGREIKSKRMVVLPWLIWLCSFVGMVVLFLMLSGCAAETFHGTCALKLLGQNENGHVIAQTYCESAK